MIKPGTEPRPERGQRATICYTGTYNGEEFDRREEYSFILGDNEAIFGRIVSLFFFAEKSGRVLTFV